MCEWKISMMFFYHHAIDRLRSVSSADVLVVLLQKNEEIQSILLINVISIELERTCPFPSSSSSPT